MIQNGIDYYNIEEQINNKEEHSCTADFSWPVSEASPLQLRSQELLDSKPRGEVEPLDSGGWVEAAAPLGPHNVKRALIQLFKNPAGAKKVKIRLNLVDGENPEFIAPLQPKSNLTNFLKHTGDHREQAREWFHSLRTHSKKQYGVLPQQGKFHLKTGARSSRLHTISVEPDCYASVSYAQEDRVYVGFLKLYDLMLSEIEFQDQYLSELQKKAAVRGQCLWINPRFDERQRPLTWAEQRKKQNK